jgi:chromosome segregation ATPase
LTQPSGITVNIRSCHDQIAAIVGQLDEQQAIKREYEVELLDHRDMITEAETVIDESNTMLDELVAFCTQLRTRHEELSHFKSVLTRQLLNSSAAQWSSVDRFRDCSCPQEAILVLETVLKGDSADAPSALSAHDM